LKHISYFAILPTHDNENISYMYLRQQVAPILPSSISINCSKGEASND